MEVGLADIASSGAFAIFAWYAWQNNKEWRMYLTERNGKLEKALDRISHILERTHHQ